MLREPKRRAVTVLVTLSLACAAGGAAATTALAAAAASGTHPAAIRVTIISPTHTPKVNVPWPVRITATTAAGKPVAATLTMVVLFDGAQVGKIDNGAVYHFVGSWQEPRGQGITWPPASRGEPLTFQVIVKSGGSTIRKDWAITVH